MGVTYKEHLAVQVLNEDRIVTYRSLSRALKVHVNVAKEMLYDFYQQQVGRKPGCIHATYLLCGVRRSPQVPAVQITQAKDDEDEAMQSSPFMRSSADGEEVTETIPVRSVVLVREDELRGVKESFEKIESIHIYSLEPSRPKDMQMFCDANREIFSTYVDEDPLEVGRQYGTIQNQHVKRRTRRGPPAQAPVMAPKVIPDRAGTGVGTRGTQDSTDTIPTAENHKSTPKPTTKPPLKKGDSDLFKSFAKAKPKAKKAAPSGPEDEPMKDASEDEQEEDLLIPKRETQGETKAQREERLRQMMDVDDEPAEEPVDSEEDREEEEEEEEEEEGEADTDTKTAEPEMGTAETAAAAAAEAPPSTAVSSNGRRRGKRRVTRKKTMKDEEGYLVTREEQVWESFSEDDVVPTAPSSTNTSAKGSTGTGTGSAGGTGGSGGTKKGKAGQGNLMAWFAKK